MDAHEDYRRAGFGGTLNAGSHIALLIVDVVRAYLDLDSPLRLDGDDAIAANQQLLAAARAAGAPVIFTTVRYTPGGREGGLFYRKVPALEVFVDGGPLGEFPAEIAPRDREMVLVKHYPSAFFGTALASTLRGMSIDTLLISGFSTSGCVRATALDALCHGFVPIVIDEACADRSPAIHSQNLFDISKKIGEVTDLAQAIDLLEK